jgi:hypothetical protein
MKLFTTILLLVFAAATVVASVPPQDITVQYDVTSGTIVFRSTVALSHAAAFKLTDGNGNVVYKDSIAKEGFLNKRFKMAALGRSDYYKVTISDEVGETSLPIKVSAKEVVVNTNKAKHLFYPTLNFHSDRTLIVAYANKSKKRVDIKIATAQGQTVFSDQVSGTEGVRRAYQLDQLRSGDYQLIVSSGDVKNHTTAFALR